MKRLFIAVIAAGGAIFGPGQASAAGIMDSFRFEFYAAAPDLHIGTDNYGHPSDFRHHGDYYLTPGYGDPQLHTSCRETRLQGEDGRTIRRIDCLERGGTAGVPLR
ncbi:MAG: hypothetical protein Q8P46_09290 [Hyphomicrobiales bacterium]|nr:hypothetical protein [Hyphomicrobiales bacterium]